MATFPATMTCPPPGSRELLKSPWTDLSFFHETHLVNEGHKLVIQSLVLLALQGVHSVCQGPAPH